VKSKMCVSGLFPQVKKLQMLNFEMPGGSNVKLQNFAFRPFWAHVKLVEVNSYAQHHYPGKCKSSFLIFLGR